MPAGLAHSYRRPAGLHPDFEQLNRRRAIVSAIQLLFCPAPHAARPACGLQTGHARREEVGAAARGNCARQGFRGSAGGRGKQQDAAYIHHIHVGERPHASPARITRYTAIPPSEMARRALAAACCWLVAAAAAAAEAPHKRPTLFCNGDLWTGDEEVGAVRPGDWVPPAVAGCTYTERWP